MVTKKWKTFRKKKSHKNKVKLQFTTPKTYLSDGMESLFPIGYLSFMVWELNTSVKYVEIILIGVAELLRCISKSGVILMA